MSCCGPSSEEETISLLRSQLNLLTNQNDRLEASLQECTTSLAEVDGALLQELPKLGVGYEKRAEVIKAIRLDRDRLAVEVERVNRELAEQGTRLSLEIERTQRQRADQLEAEAGVMREALLQVSNEGTVYDAVSNAEAGCPACTMVRGSHSDDCYVGIALSYTAGKRALAQLDAGRRLAEAAKALRARIKAISVQMSGRHYYQLTNGPTTSEVVVPLDDALEAWDRAAAGGGA